MNDSNQQRPAEAATHPPVHAEIESLRDIKARYRIAMQSSLFGMATLSAEGLYLEVNPAFARLMGTTPEQMRGTDFHAYTHPDDHSHCMQQLDEVRRGQRSRAEFEKRFIASDGRTVWGLVTAEAVRDGDGRFLYYLAQCCDVTRLHKVEDDLREMNHRLEERVQSRTAHLQDLLRQQEAFSFGVSHDLRAPLRAIDSYLAHFRKQAGALPPEQDALLDKIGNASTQTGELLDALLEYSRVGRTELHPREVDLGEQVDWALMELQSRMPDREPQIAVDGDLALVGDERLLRLLMTKLLENSWRFADPERGPDVRVLGERTPRGLHVRVIDRGIGFDPHHADRLFQPFQRLHAASEGGGMGLGLAIARVIVERHRGRIWAESEPGRGTTIHVELPERPSMVLDAPASG